MLRMLAIAFVTAVTAVGATMAGTGRPNNVHGTLDRSGAGSPGCFPDEPCDPVPVGRFVVFSREGHPPVRVRVPQNGSFAARLAPGTYRISLAPPPLSGHVRPATVRAPHSGVAHLTLKIRG